MAAHEWLGHTADVKLHLTASTLPEIFQQGVIAVANFLYNHPDHNLDACVEQDLVISAPNNTRLLVDFLSDLIAYSTVHQACFTHCTVNINQQTHSLVAKLQGYHVDHFDAELKAATYHEASVEKYDSGYQATIIFDI